MNANELRQVIENMEKERGIDRESLVQMVEAALVAASKKSAGFTSDLHVTIDRTTLQITTTVTKEIVELVNSRDQQISLSEAVKIKPDAKIGDTVEVEIPTKTFGRIAAQTAKQAIIQKIRQAENEIVVKEYKDRVGDIVSGSIVRVERGDIIIDLGRVETIMPARERVPLEDYQIGDHIRAYIVSVQDHSSGYHVVLSRSHPNFVKRLFELEISEIADHTVEIKGVAREAGYRTKIAVVSHDEKVDPVGACVGMRGMRVKNIIRELMGERIDIVRWHEDIKTYVTNALAPAKLKKVSLDEAEHKATVIVTTDQLSLAIGKRGQNARLTSKLLGWKIDIQKDKDDISFDEKISQAVEGLAKVPGIDQEKAGKLVHAGFLTIEGIVEAAVNDLEETTGFDAETAKAIHEAAAAAMPQDQNVDQK